MTKHPKRRRAGRPPSSKQAGSDSRAQLLGAAAKVFAARGYQAASVDAIAAEARLSKGTFYWHFDSKEQLFLALLEERVDRPVQALMEVTRSAPVEQATAPVVSQGLAELFGRERELVLLLHEYWSAAARDPSLRARYLERQAVLRATLADALTARHASAGVPLAMPAKDLATAFIALAEGLSLEAVQDPDSISEQLFGEILSLVYDGMAARAERAGSGPGRLGR